MTVAPLFADPPAASFDPFPVNDANLLLSRWEHYLGPCRRPFGADAWALTVAGEPVAVAVGASIVSAQVAGLWRNEVVELARLCAVPGSPWARVILRLWRELAGPAWPYWTALAAVSYSHSRRHLGDVYRFDGWRLGGEVRASGGGGTWSSSPAASGRKRLWVHRYAPVPLKSWGVGVDDVAAPPHAP